MILRAVDWREMFAPTQSLAELFLRGTVMYLFFLALMRVFRREAGSLSIPDLLVVVLWKARCGAGREGRCGAARVAGVVA